MFLQLFLNNRKNYLLLYQMDFQYYLLGNNQQVENFDR